MLGERAIGGKEVADGDLAARERLDAGAGDRLERGRPRAGEGATVHVIDADDDLRPGVWVDVVDDLGDRSDDEPLRRGAPLFDEFSTKGGDGALAAFDLATGELERGRPMPRIRAPTTKEHGIRAEPDEPGGDEQSR